MRPARDVATTHDRLQTHEHRERDASKHACTHSTGWLFARLSVYEHGVKINVFVLAHGMGWETPSDDTCYIFAATSNSL